MKSLTVFLSFLLISWFCARSAWADAGAPCALEPVLVTVNAADGSDAEDAARSIEKCLGSLGGRRLLVADERAAEAVAARLDLEVDVRSNNIVIASELRSAANDATLSERATAELPNDLSCGDLSVALSRALVVHAAAVPPPPAVVIDAHRADIAIYVDGRIEGFERARVPVRCPREGVELLVETRVGRERQASFSTRVSVADESEPVIHVDVPLDTPACARPRPFVVVPSGIEPRDQHLARWLGSELSRELSERFGAVDVTVAPSVADRQAAVEAARTAQASLLFRFTVRKLEGDKATVEIEQIEADTGKTRATFNETLPATELYERFPNRAATAEALFKEGPETELSIELAGVDLWGHVNLIDVDGARAQGSPTKLAPGCHAIRVTTGDKTVLRIVAVGIDRAQHTVVDLDARGVIGPENTPEKKPEGLGRDLGPLATSFAVGALLGGGLGLVIAPIASELDHGSTPTANEIVMSVGVGLLVVQPLAALVGGATADLPAEAMLSAYVVSMLFEAVIITPTIAFVSDNPDVPEWVGPLAVTGASVVGLAMGTLAAYIANEVIDSDAAAPKKHNNTVTAIPVPVFDSTGGGVQVVGTF
ncbi:MAG: hypothetical protein U0271_45455 [Polyangiaceae bacterium]